MSSLSANIFCIIPPFTLLNSVEARFIVPYSYQDKKPGLHLDEHALLAA
jgi:hypothetical protein